MEILFIAGFFVVSLTMAFVMSIATLRQYAPSVAENFAAYNALSNNTYIARSGVKVFQTPQAKIIPAPISRTVIFSVVRSSSSNRDNPANIGNEINLQITA